MHGPTSLALNEYYSHKSNAFWYRVNIRLAAQCTTVSSLWRVGRGIMGNVFEFDHRALTFAERCNQITAKGKCLLVGWSVVWCVSRERVKFYCD